MADLGHRATRIVDQRPDVVHDRLLQLAARLQSELPPIPAGSQAATALGMSGPMAIAVDDRGPRQIDVRTTEGRIRAEASADLAPAAGDRTTLTLTLEIKPQGFAANMILGVALKTMPDLERTVIDGLETGLDDLVTELAKPDETWDPAAWVPPGLPTND